MNDGTIKLLKHSNFTVGLFVSAQGRHRPLGLFDYRSS